MPAWSPINEKTITVTVVSPQPPVQPPTTEPTVDLRILGLATLAGIMLMTAKR